MKNYKVLLREKPDKIVTVKADKYIIERRGTLAFYVDKYSGSGTVKVGVDGIRAFNSAAWREVWVEDE